MTNVLEVADLSVSVSSRAGSRSVLRGVSLSLGAGEALGLVGESGCGKSMTAKAITLMLPSRAQSTGRILFEGTSIHDLDRKAVARYRRHGVSLVPQDPRAAINPVHTIGDFLVEPQVVVDGRRSADAYARAVEALSDVGIRDGARCMEQYPHQLSGGMLQRVMICSALLAESSVIVADEPTTALDVTTQSEVMAILDELRLSRGLSLLFITHDLELAAAVCDRISVMYAGSIVESQTARGIEAAPRHPYTQALFAARPDISAVAERLVTIPGSSLSAYETGPGCGFIDRCPLAETACGTQPIPLTRIGDADVRCRRVGEPAPAEPHGERHP